VVAMDDARALVQVTQVLASQRVTVADTSAASTTSLEPFAKSVVGLVAMRAPT
jgi:hypothetical protein